MEEVEEIMEEEYPSVRTVAGMVCEDCEDIEQVWATVKPHVTGLIRSNKAYLHQYGRNVWTQVMLIHDKDQPVSVIKIGFFGNGAGTYESDRPNAPVQLTCTVKTELILDLLKKDWSGILHNKILKDLDPDATERMPDTCTVRMVDRAVTGYVASTYIDLLCF